MPLYDFRCKGECGYYTDMFIPLAEVDNAVCPDCQGEISIRIGAVMTIGPMPSKPLKISHVGRSFESASEYRDYQRNNPDCAILEANLADQREKRGLERKKQRGEVDAKVFV